MTDHHYDAFPSDTLCARCGETWGDHTGYTCPNGATRFIAMEKASQTTDVTAVLEKASPTTDVTAVLEERGKRYGKFKDHARISQEMKRVMQKTDGWHNLGATGREALEMIAHKIARILNGDPTYADSWVDIAGYAKLVADRLEGVER